MFISIKNLILFKNLLNTYLMLKNILLSMLFMFVCCINSQSQNKKEIDSLLLVIATTKSDSIQVQNYNKVAWHYVFSDTIQAKKYLANAENIARKNKKSYGYHEILNLRGIMMDIKGKSDSAKYYFEKTLQSSRANRHIIIEVRSINNLGMLNWNQGNFKTALNYFLEGLKRNEDLPTDKKIKNSIFYNNIGLIYQELNLNEKALDYHKKAYAARKKDNQAKDIVSSLNNIGICYHSLNKNKEALKYYKMGLKMAYESKNFIDYYKITENIGNALQSEKLFKESIPYYEKVLSIKEDVAVNPKTIIGVYTGLSSAYNETGDTQKALFYGKKGLEILKENPDFKHYSYPLYQQISRSYYMTGDRKNGTYYNNLFIEVLQDKFSADNAKSIADMEIKYQTATKEKMLAENKAKLLKNEIETRKKNVILISLVVLISFVALFGFLYSRQQRLKNKQQKQEFQLKNAIARIESQNELQEQRLSISRDLHDNIGAQLTFIVSSVDNIKYAFPVIDASLNNKIDTISDFTKATIQELRDTIWAMNSSEITFEDLHSRILNFITKAQKSQEHIAFKFLIQPQLKQIKLTSVEGMNVYRTIQEALNNAIKHAKAQNISVEITQESDFVQIVIDDDGTGIDEQRIVKGNGLLNMTKRIEEIGGQIHFQKKATNGTQIQLKIKI